MAIITSQDIADSMVVAAGGSSYPFPVDDGIAPGMYAVHKKYIPYNSTFVDGIDIMLLRKPKGKASDMCGAVDGCNGKDGVVFQLVIGCDTLLNIMLPRALVGRAIYPVSERYIKMARMLEIM